MQFQSFSEGEKRWCWGDIGR